MRVGHLKFWLAIAAVLSLLLAGCSTTTITGSWKDSEVTQPVTSMLVMARMEEQFLRHSTEDWFAISLQDRGVNAVASYRVFPAAADLNRDEVEKKAVELGLEAFLIVRVLAQETVEEPYGGGGYPAGYSFYEPSFYRRGHFRSWDRYYGYGYDYPYAPTLTRETTVLRLETSVYRPGEEGLLWAVRSETTATAGLEEHLREIARKVVAELTKANLI